jgi:oligopeptide/dipeptide ABC transporter ATP-binding protein
MTETLLKVENPVKHYPVRGGLGHREVVHAVDGVTLPIYESETLGLIGESGCGKSTLGRCMLRLEKPTSGRIVFQGRDITDLSERELRPLRRDMQMIFQDPYSSLNPRKRIGRIIGNVLRVHGTGNGEGQRSVDEEVAELLRRVGLRPEHARRYPRAFSGGQRQRIDIARALALRPHLIVADEPVSALVVPVQAQVINLLAELQEEFRLTYPFIAHDLGVVRQISDRVGVMYLGSLVEVSGGDDLHEKPIHPYTEALLSAVPIPDPEVSTARKRIILHRDLPSPSHPPPGCHFHTRCPYATEICREVVPPLVEHGNGHLAACHHPLNVGEEGETRAQKAAVSGP